MTEEEVVINLPQDMHKLCRTCLTVTDDLSHDILLTNEEQTTLAGQMLEFCFSYEVSPKDGLPKSICEECANKLEIVYNFRHQCDKSDLNLRNLLNVPIDNKKNTKKNNVADKFQLINAQSIESKIEAMFKETEEDNEIINFEEENNSNATSLQMSVLKLIEDRKETGNKSNEDNLDYEDIFSLVEERKENSLTKTTKIKEEILSDSEEIPNSIFCNMCNTFFNNTSEFENHSIVCKNKIQLTKNVKKEKEEEESKNGPPYNCTICGIQFITKQSRNVHLSMHNHPIGNSKIETFSCDICNKIFTSETKLVTHYYKHALFVRKDMEINNLSIDDILQEVDNECFSCKAQFENQEDLQLHAESHLTEDDVKCDFCYHHFKGELNLSRHMKKHNICIVFCKICVKRFDSFAKLKEHIRSHDLEGGSYFCAICKQNFNSVENLKYHLVQHLDEVYECNKCKRNFNNRIYYENHKKQHYEPRFLCSLCGKQYFSSSTLESHIRGHNNEKPFECPHCKKCFTSRATLSVHKRIHSGFKPYVCNYCGYSCRQSGDLAMHIRTHTGERPYNCKFPNCERKFTTASQRKEHYRRHTNERNHKCGVCGKAFLESKTLKVHMLTHTGEKPHSCEVCGKRFRRMHHLTNHMKGHKNV